MVDRACRGRQGFVMVDRGRPYVDMPQASMIRCKA